MRWPPSCCCSVSGSSAPASRRPPWATERSKRKSTHRRRRSVHRRPRAAVRPRRRQVQVADIDRARPRRVKENMMNKPRGAGRGRRLSLSLGACILLGLMLSACSQDGKELSTLNPKGPYSRSIDRLFVPVGFIALAVLFFVLASVMYMWFRFRVKDHTEGEWPTQNHGNTKLEITWTIIPMVILVMIFVPSLAVLQKLNSDPNQ